MQQPKILVRNKAIILGIEHVRAIILNDRVLLFNHTVCTYVANMNLPRDFGVVSYLRCFSLR
jgi:hypothetical protein